MIETRFINLGMWYPYIILMLAPEESNVYDSLPNDIETLNQINCDDKIEDLKQLKRDDIIVRTQISIFPLQKRCNFSFIKVVDSDTKKNCLKICTQMYKKFLNI
uniref:Uncharacterized protein n=1 Tax=viral metagenome TaxID=1070528 RepID=A0A6C0LUJ3_9ZZZZ